MNAFNYKNNTLYCEHVPLSELVENFGTPLYIYSQDQLTKNYNVYKECFSSTKPLICYAIKANSNLSILKHFANLGSGFDIVSGGELAKVIAAGGSPKKTIFSGVGKTREEMKFALENDILCFNVESENELYRLNDVAAQMGKQAPISLRINPNVDAKTHPYISTGLKENKFGIAYQDALRTYLLAKTLPNLLITGIDCHIGSQLLDVAPLIEAFEKIILLVDRLAEEGIHLKHIDMGGGIGIPYEEGDELPDLQAYAEAIQPKLAQYAIQLILEPGRSLVGNTGAIATKIEYIKQTEHKNFVIVDAAMNDLIRPSLYEAHHEILPLSISDKEPIMADIVGPICESGDFLGKDRLLAASENDYLVIKDAGAYASSMASNYNIRPRAAEVLVSDNSFRLIRKRESIEQLMENENKCL